MIFDASPDYKPHFFVFLYLVVRIVEYKICIRRIIFCHTTYVSILPGIPTVVGLSVFSIYNGLQLRKVID